MSGSEKRLSGKKILITGAGSGIGKAMALRFAREGATIAVNDISAESAEKTAKEVKELGQESTALVADVTSTEQVQQLVKDYYSKHDILDVLVNNAGVGSAMCKITTLPEETWDRIMNVNLRSVFLMCKYFSKKMKKRDVPKDQLRGKIINLSSTRGLEGRALMGAYGASKAGVRSLTQTLARELGPYRITCNALLPGLIHTPMYGNIKYEDLVGQNATPIALEKYKPVGLAEDVANVAFFLASDDSNWVTGQSLVVSGGMMFV
ncbi:MAG: SDR family NAD(P)-dependent oxidoreductase [Candidatus Hodarchaeota archaeon]